MKLYENDCVTLSYTINSLIIIFGLVSINYWFFVEINMMVWHRELSNVNIFILNN